MDLTFLLNPGENTRISRTVGSVGPNIHEQQKRGGRQVFGELLS